MVSRICLLVVLLIPTMSFAQGGNLQPNGYASYEELGEQVYIAGLFLASPTRSPANILSSSNKRLEIKFVTEKLSARRFKNTLVRRSAINNTPNELVENARAMESFLGYLKGDFVHGDHLVLESSSAGFTVSQNGVRLGEVRSETLFNVLLNVWIGDVPPSRDFKAALLGSEPNGAARDAFNVLAFSEDRAESLRERVALTAAPRSTPPPIVVSLPTAPRPVISTPKPTRAPTPTPQVAVVATPTPKPKVAIVSTPKPTVAPTPVPTRAPTPTPEPVIVQEEEDNEFSAENLLAAQLYVNQLKQHTQRNMTYPATARRLGQEGKVVVNITIDRDGSVQDFNVTEEARFRVLNNEVRRGIRRAQPFPEMPAQIRGENFNFDIPINFSLGE